MTQVVPTRQLRIYFIKPVGLAGPVKIGCSRQPEDRLIAMMRWSPVPLEIVLSVAGDFKMEYSIHRSLAASHSHSEWFFATEEVLDLLTKLSEGVPIGEAIGVERPVKPTRKHRQFPPTKLADYLVQTQMKPSQLAARMGKPASTITRLLNGTRSPSIDLARQIAEATNGAVTANDFMNSRPHSPSEEAA